MNGDDRYDARITVLRCGEEDTMTSYGDQHFTSSIDEIIKLMTMSEHIHKATGS
jgi:hypothetical protein